MKIPCKFADLAERALERGYYIEEVMGCICERHNHTDIVVDTSHPSYPAKPRRGPGTVLKVLLKKLGFHHQPGCKCEDHARTMNRWGADLCEKNIDVISGWLRDEAKSRGLVYVDSLGKSLISVSIRLSRRRK